MDIDPELHRRLKIAAAAHDVTITAFVERVIQHALDEEGSDAAWSRRSAPAFGRDWESGEDAVYDNVSSR